MELTKKDLNHINEEVRKVKIRIDSEASEYERLYRLTYLTALRDHINDEIDAIQYLSEQYKKVSDPN